MPQGDAVARALALIARLYWIEGGISEAGLCGDAKRAYRLEHIKPVVDAFFAWCRGQLQRSDLVPLNPLSKAFGAGLASDPMGRKAWLFCWTELGAEHVGIIQSLISTCKLHQINPYTYLSDVLQRVGEHPANRVAGLTPRCWKVLFADNPLRSALHGAGASAVAGGE